MDVLMIVLGFLAMAAYFGICGRQRRPIKSAAVNSAAGVVLLVLTAVVSGFFGGGISVNYISVFVSSVLGVPGVIMMLLITFVI